jgi:hypothetical protein
MPLVLAAAALVASGCHLASPDQLDECHRLSQTLRSENAQLKDQMLALRSQNQDYAERAVDDARRLAQLESVNQRLETSVQAYQDERTRLESAYKELRASLPGSQTPLGMDSQKQKQDEPAAEEISASGRPVDPAVKRASGSSRSVQARLAQKPRAKRAHGGWAPAQADEEPEGFSPSIRIDP